MYTIENILIPVDFRHDEEGLLEYAYAMAGQASTKVLLVHVKEPEDEAIEKEAAAEGKALSAEMRLSGLIGRGKQLGLDCDGRIVEGKKNVECLLGAAREFEANCIMMAACAHTAVDRLVVSSTYNELIRESPVPVMAVRPRVNALREKDDLAKLPRTILCPVDESEFSQSAVSIAAALCRFYEAALTVVHVYEGKPDTREADVHEHELRQRFERSIGTDSGIKTRFLMLSGPTSETLSRAIDLEDADLVVIATHGRSKIPQVFAPSVAESIVSMATCPVITIRPDLMHEFSGELEASESSEKS